MTTLAVAAGAAAWACLATLLNVWLCARLSTRNSSRRRACGRIALDENVGEVAFEDKKRTTKSSTSRQATPANGDSSGDESVSFYSEGVRSV